MRVEIWSDVVCPWCYVGKRRFEQALASFPHRDEVEVVWRSFELDATAPAERTEGQAEHLAHKYGRTLEQAHDMLDAMAATAAQDGLDFRFAQMRGGNTFDAHRLLHLAGERGVQDALKERLLRATFTEGSLVSDVDTLVRLGAEVGLDADEAREVLHSDRYAEDVRADQRDAQRFGITGVPFFVVDRTYGVSGAQSAEVLRQVLDKAWADTRPVQLVTTGGGPGCEGDACAV